MNGEKRPRWCSPCFRPTPLIPPLDFQSHSVHGSYDPALHNDSDIRQALQGLLDAVASDLGCDDLKDPGFLDYMGDTLSDHGVPHDAIERARAWCRNPRRRS